MTDNSQSAKPGRRFKTVLLVSLAVNLFFAGLLIGGPLFFDGPKRDGGHRGGPDMGMMPNPRVLVEVLGPEEGRRAQRQLRREVPGMRQKFMAIRASHKDVLRAMRADPYDPDALVDALTNVRNKHMDVASAFQKPFADLLADLTPEQRAKMADAIETMRSRRGRHAGEGRPALEERPE